MKAINMKFIAHALLALLVLTSVNARAARYGDENRSHNPMMPNQVNTKWQQECSGCHLAFPPGLLPAASWRKIMSGLSQHFAADASLSPQDVSEITDFLVKNQANRGPSDVAPPRITEAKWFIRKHREVSPTVWKRAAIKSASNCMACHHEADQGIFDEHKVKIPK